MLGLIRQFEDLSPLRSEPGKVPVWVSLRNSIFDSIFYDTSKLTNLEKSTLLAEAFGFDEGGMLYVYPSSDERKIEYFSLSNDLVSAHPELTAVAIPGVGSGVIGSAALARQVADTIQKPVVGIIAGYGAADLMSEALGGWFDFGTSNRIRSMLAEVKRRLAPTSQNEKRDIAEKYQVKSTTFFVEEPESNTLLNIMLRHADQLELIVGHSKGALNIANVLNAFTHETQLAPEVYEDVQVVTFGCPVATPAAFKHVRQYVGTLDVLGALNTPYNERFDETVIRIDGKSHNLCSWNPFHMPIENLIPLV